MTEDLAVSEDLSATDSLTHQQHSLRRKMAVQRQLIARQLGPARHLEGEYPRSMTMRLLTRRPELAIRIFIGVATVLAGTRASRSISTVLSLASIVRAAFIRR